jgi:hypothetical protein
MQFNQTTPSANQHADEFLLGWAPQSFPKKKDENESRRVAAASNAAPSQCWFNARRVIDRMENYAKASYVEGWCVLNGGMCVEHGWLVLNGVIIDPTLPEGVIAYFPGLEFRGREGIADFLKTREGRKCRKSPFFYAFGWGGGQSRSFMAAYRRCLEFVDSLIARDS